MHTVVLPLGKRMRVELEKGAARASALRITAWTYSRDCAQTRLTTMAKKLSQPVKKSSAKAKAKGARKVMASGCAKPAWKRGAKAAQSAKRATGKPAKRAVKTTRPARTPVAKQTARTASSRSMKKPAIKRTPRALAKAKAPKPVAKNAWPSAGQAAAKGEREACRKTASPVRQSARAGSWPGCEASAPAKSPQGFPPSARKRRLPKARLAAARTASSCASSS